MHYNIVNRQGYVIGLALVMGSYSYYMLNKDPSNNAVEINTDELYEKFKLEFV